MQKDTLVDHGGRAAEAHAQVFDRQQGGRGHGSALAGVEGVAQGVTDEGQQQHA
jgi:hypothetical protein